MMKKKIVLILISSVLFTQIFGIQFTFAQSASPSPSPTSSTVQDLQNKINDLQNKINDLQGQEKTLSSQIAVYDSQIKLTTYKIAETEQQIADLTLNIDTASKKITNIQSSIDNLKLAQAHDKKLIYDTVQAKNDYSNQKNIFEDQKKQVEALNAQLQSYTDQLNGQKAQEAQLLSETQGSEANYQQQLSQAQAELAGFGRFVSSQGGSGLLSNQTQCDGWGCYYNQRDSQWGNIGINGQGDYSMAGYGCLITSIAMMASHYGHREILPSDIATSDGSNFSVGTAMLRFTITVKGVTISRNSAALDSALQNGPVIVGIYAYGGTHFVVIKSGSGGNYTMDDPYIAGGKDISFTDHYSTGSIFEIDTISM